MPNRDKEPAMADAILADMQRVARLAAEPRAPGDSTKAAISRAARSLKLSYRRARSFWYATPGTAVRAWEAEQIRAEELNILARRRQRLEQEMEWIKARLNAQEGSGHGNGPGHPGVDDTKLAKATGDQVLSVHGGSVERDSEAVREEGLIPDLRQRAFL